MPADSFRRIIESLERHGVEYVVVGGVAAVLHGAPVTTFDIDALVRVTPENGVRLLDALTALDARFRERPDRRPTQADVAAGGHMLLLTNCGPLDVLGFIAGRKRFEDVDALTETFRIGELAVRVLSLEALIEDKRLLNRDKDKAVIALLEAIQRRRSERRTR